MLYKQIQSVALVLLGANEALAWSTTQLSTPRANVRMGAFDDMMAKTAKRDNDRATAAAAPPAPAVFESESLAQKMANTVSEAGGNKIFPAAAKLFGIEVDEEEDTAIDVVTGDGADAEVADIDQRAQTGDITFKDFLTMAEAAAGLGDSQLPGMPTLTPAQMAETREKFEKHSKICEVMLDDELDNPSLLIEDLKAGGSTPGPRIQRLAVASGQPETEVGLFLMQFEAMRESTRRIAEGEDPDEVTESMGAPPGSNRQARRAAKKRSKKVKK